MSDSFQEVMDLLEKRVKSRFSHLQIYFAPIANFETFLSCFETLLEIQKEDIPRITAAACKKFNDSVSKFMVNDDVQDVARKCFEMSNDVNRFKQFLVWMLLFLFAHLFRSGPSHA